MIKKKFIKYIPIILIAVHFLWGAFSFTYATNITVPVPNISINLDATESPQGVANTLQVFALITIIGLLPFILLMFTSFTRIIVVLHFLRSALGTQQMPPNQILIAIALFLTFFLMSPVFVDINENAIKPYAAGEIVQEQALTRGMKPLRDFMFRQVDDKEIDLFRNLSGEGLYESFEDIPNTVLIPAFMICELKKGFMIGFIIYIPFIVIDMVVASTLMAMGMMMLPPAMISLPFKIMLFILVDGWELVIGNLIRTFK